MSTPINPLNLHNYVSLTHDGKAPAWKPGQLLHAIFIKRMKNGESLLKVGDTLVQAKVTRQLQVGDKLLLELIKNGPKPVLRLYTSASQASSKQHMINNAIKQHIAKQNSVTLLLNSIQTIHAQKSSGMLPVNIRELLKLLLVHTPKLKQFATGDGFKRAFQQSGILLEQKLFGRQQPFTNNTLLSNSVLHDSKAILLKLKQQLDSATKQTATNRTSELKDYQNIAKQGIISTSAKSNNEILQSQLKSNNAKVINVPLVEQRTARLPVSGAIQYQTMVAGTSSNVFSLKPLMRSNTPHPAASSVNFFQMSNAQLPSSTQGLIHLLMKLVESALARITVSQLNSVPVDTDNKQVWLLDLPISKGKEEPHDLVQTKIETDRDANIDDPERLWTVQLAMDLPSLGPLQATISIRDNQVETQFFSSDRQQKQIIEEHLDILRSNLSKAGLQIKKLFCTEGLQDEVILNKLQQLLDEKA